MISLDLNVDEDCDDIISSGRLFHVCAAVMGNARLPMVWRHVDGTASVEVDDECKQCWSERSVTSCSKALAKSAGTSPWTHQYTSMASLYKIHSGTQSQGSNTLHRLVPINCVTALKSLYMNIISSCLNCIVNQLIIQRAADKEHNRACMDATFTLLAKSASDNSCLFLLPSTVEHWHH